MVESEAAEAAFPITPTHDHIAIRRRAEMSGGLYIPQTATAQSGPQFAEVLAVGPGRMSEHCCKVIPMPDVNVGDTIRYHGGAGFDDEIDGLEFRWILRGDVIGVMG